MIKKILYARHPVYWILFHLAMGVIATFSPVPVILYFYFILVSELNNLISGTIHQRNVSLVFTISYLTSFELLARMSKTSPFIPYELSKYLLFFLLLFGIIQNNPKNVKGLILCLLLLPALMYDYSGEVTFNNIVYNLIGPLNLGLAVVLFSRFKISRSDFIYILKLLLFPLLSVLAFTVFKTPDFDKIDFSLGANFETSGDFGSNQVSTVLGFAAFLVFLFWLNKWQLSKYRWLDTVILFAFVFQGLLTFSRGGMLGAAFGVMIVLYFTTTSSAQNRKLYKIPGVSKYLFPALIVFIMAFSIADKVTDGNLLLRYRGETAGTISGTKERNLNSITTNRLNIFMDDISLWSQYPVFGVGVGASKYLRSQNNIANSHIELSRLLAEHGVFGLFFFALAISLSWNIYVINADPLIKAILLAFFIIAIYTSFHAAMRTYITPLLVGISLMYIKPLIRTNAAEEK